MITRKRAVAIALTLIMITAAGCAGWGTDGPATDQQENQTPDSGQGEDVEETNDGTQADDDNNSGASGDGTGTESANNSSGDTDDGSDAASGDTDTDSSTSGDGDASDGSDSDSDTGTDGDSATDTGDGDADSGSDEGDSESGDGTGSDGDTSAGDGDGDDESGDDADSGTHTLTVTVYDHEGNPLPDASVSVVTDPGTGGGEDVGSATTNESGVAEFEVEDGAYEVSASHDAYQADGITGPVNVQGEDTSVDVAMPDSDDGNGDEDPETHTLTVNLANHDIDGVAVTAERDGGPDGDPETWTKASAGGQVSFHDLEPGLYYVDAEGYNQTMVGIEVDEDTEITLQHPDPDPIAIEVVNAETGEPIEGAEVSGVCDLWYSSGDVYITGETDANGVAQAQAGVAPTDCDASVEADGYETTHLSLSVPDDDGISVELTSAPAADGGTGNETSTADENETAVQAIAA